VPFSIIYLFNGKRVLIMLSFGYYLRPNVITINGAYSIRSNDWRIVSEKNYLSLLSKIFELSLNLFWGVNCIKIILCIRKSPNKLWWAANVQNSDWTLKVHKKVSFFLKQEIYFFSFFILLQVDPISKSRF
jgi:hypothetical protein